MVYEEINKLKVFIRRSNLQNKEDIEHIKKQIEIANQNKNPYINEEFPSDDILNTELLNYCIESLELVKFIIGLGGSPNFIEHHGRLPIFDAIAYKQHEVAEYLFHLTHFDCSDAYACQAFRYLFDKDYKEFYPILRSILFRCKREHIISGRSCYRRLRDLCHLQITQGYL